MAYPSKEWCKEQQRKRAEYEEQRKQYRLENPHRTREDIAKGQRK